MRPLSHIKNRVADWIFGLGMLSGIVCVVMLGWKAGDWVNTVWIIGLLISALINRFK